ncbi:amino acid ABC transporter permease [Tsukamurella tyrosinosolvens]|uniref:Glutamate transport system permease protein n=1 Tax=Tsukamurella tyrosinosolvens TaxID=57704 RepID=A0A1H4S609_TSUTY|nr:amino acid ABC transporter permease [Tsukamurella tyrosinosolvens]AUN40237.1 glutamate ABC transporter permease [Tsukamurella tyrosinosolvens]KXO93549.1 glutamate ABC transporter permease [Tsukamurella tyrosinosolvens]KXP05683.1 glutamate ABC transporter permease [Tsukamurella tyrosinosolvens]KZL95501.1 glutamate ABC transporter permease [Tsukamurella tyrosinosolvens]MCA4993722.1 amino acid ABC transporter permease [Tsukamurella tyrosinosolvens]
MSTKSTSTVLYDAPGPKARVRNNIIAVVFIVVLVALFAWVITAFAANGQFDQEKLEPFADANYWGTYILPGLWGTFKAALASIILAMIMGAFLGIGRLSDHRSVRWATGAIVEFFRAIPVLILIYFLYIVFGVYKVFTSDYIAFFAVVFGLTLYNGSVIAEILRSGINSLPNGQFEAAKALGLRKSQTMRLILLPQAVAAMLPALISQMVIALKDSALGYQIGYIEVVKSGIQAGNEWGNVIPSLIVVAIIMILINFGLSALASNIEKNLREGRKKKLIVDPPHALPEPGLMSKEVMETTHPDPKHRDLRQDYGD